MILKPGEREAIAQWWSESQVVKGFIAGAAVAIIGLGCGYILSAAISACIDLN